VCEHGRLEKCKRCNKKEEEVAINYKYDLSKTIVYATLFFQWLKANALQ